MDVMKCKKCGGKVEIREAELRIYNISLGMFRFKVCNCGAAVFNESSIEEISKAIIDKGLFGLGSVVRVGKLGDSLMIRIGKRLTNFLQLKKGIDVKVYPVDKDKFLVEVPCYRENQEYQKDISPGQYQKGIKHTLIS